MGKRRYILTTARKQLIREFKHTCPPPLPNSTWDEKQIWTEKLFEFLKIKDKGTNQTRKTRVEKWVYEMHPWILNRDEAEEVNETKEEEDEEKETPGPQPFDVNVVLQKLDKREYGRESTRAVTSAPSLRLFGQVERAGEPDAEEEMQLAAARLTKYFETE